MRPIAPLLALITAVGFTAAPAADLWVEAEHPAAATVQRHPWWYDQVKKDQLSGGDFVSNWSADKDGALAYDVDVAEAGAYTLWLRANPVGAKLGWRIDGGDWKEVDFGPAQDQVNLAADGKPDMRFVAWVKAGKPELKAGKHRVEFLMHSDNNHHGMLDCFLLTTAAFAPKGARKPGEAPAKPLALDGRWAFDPEVDAFAKESLLDLRDLNEKEAGEHGFIARTKDGDFARGDGAKIRFWAMHSDVWGKGYDAEREHARFLAKRGVNLVRFHANLPSDASLEQPNQQVIAQIWDGVAAMKEQGIYSCISPYYPHANGLDDAKRQRWGVTTKANNMTGLVFFDPKVQAAYKGWLRALLEPKNPRTGVALKDEPALAIIQIENEDSLLFWTLGSIADHPLLQKAFGDWAAKAHGSVQGALDAWKEAVDGDDAAHGRLGLRGPWDMTADGIKQKGRSARLADQVRFLGETMRDWNAEVVRFLREDIGAKQLVNAGNWRTADPVTLGDVERWSYAATDVQGMNHYTGSYHGGANAGWAVAAGDRYGEYSALTEPTSLPIAIKQPVGQPFIIPESTWTPPTLHQSEGPLLISAYMSLNGVDAYFWFSTGDVQWTAPKSANGYLASVGKWIAATPELLGEFPAAALMYRKGYIARGEPVVHEERALDDLWSLKIPAISEEGAFDPNRDPGAFGAKSTVRQEVDRLAFLVGPVEVVYGGDPSKTAVSPRLAELIDTKAKRVTSVTGEIALDYAGGVCRVNAAKAQGVSGFLKKAAPRTELKDVVIESANDYATILAVSLDDQPLASAKRVLIQVGTECRPTGWAEKPVEITDGGRTFPGWEITDHGTAPWQVVKTEATITLRNPGITEAVALDMNGLPRGALTLEKVAGGVRFALPPDAMYVVAR